MAELQFNAGEENFRELFHAVPIPMGYADAEGNIISFNKRFQELFGYSKKDIPTLDSWWEIAYPDPKYRNWVLKTWYQEVKKALNENTDIESIEYDVTCKNGDTKTTIIRGSTVQGGFLVTFKDVTEQKRIEKELHTTQIHYSDFINVSSDHISYWKMPDGLRTDLPIEIQVEKILQCTCIDGNKSIWKQYGFKSKDELIGKQYVELIQNADVKLFEKFIKNNYRINNEEYLEVFNDGSESYAIENWYGVIENKELKYLWASSRNITAQKRAEKALAYSEESIKKVILNTSGKQGKEFFTEMAKTLEEVTKSTYSFIGETIPKNEVTTIAFSHQGKILDNFTYAIQGTPCENVIGQASCIYEKNVSRLFTKDQLLIDMGIEAYVGTPILNHLNEHVGIIVSLFDHPITESEFIKSIFEVFANRIAGEIERIKIEHNLRASEKKFKSIVDNTSVGIATVSVEGKFMFVNYSICQILGYSAEELRNMTFSDYTYPDDIGLDVEKYKRLINGEIDSYSIEKRYIHKNCSIVWGSLTVSAVKDNEGIVQYSIAMLEDITTRKKALEDTIKSESEKRQILQSIVSGLYIYDLVEHRNIYINKAYTKITGWNIEEMEAMGEKVFELFHPDDLTNLSAHIQKLAQDKGGNSYSLLYRLRSKDGNWIWCESYDTPYLRDSDGNVIQFIGSFIDVGKRIKAQEEILKLNKELEERVIKRTEELQESERKFRELSTLLPAALFETDSRGYITYINKYGISITGYSEEEILSEISILDIISPEGHSNIRTNITKKYSGEASKPIEYMLISKNNEEKPVLGYTVPIIENDKHIGLRGILMDISLLKKAQAEVTKLSEAVIHSPSTVVITDPEGIIEYVNPKFTEVTGYTPEEAIRIRPSILKSGFHSKDFYTEMWKTLKTGNIWQGEICSKKKNGEIFWESTSISSIKDKEGNNIHYIAVKEDITLQKKMHKELQDAKEKAEAATQAKSEFLANMSHEIRTPMNAIIGFSEILSKKINDPINKDYLDSLKSAGKTLLNLINDILDFSKIEAKKLELQIVPVNIRSLIKEIENIFTLKVREKRLDLFCEISNEIPDTILLDELRIKQVLINLINNSIKFTNVGRITLKVSCQSNHINEYDITFQVIDTGIGIAEEDQKQIFEAFKQREKQDTRVYGGTGLGLAISNSLIGLMGSKIELDSTPGVGSNFYFTIKDTKIKTDKEETTYGKVNLDRVVFEKAKILVVDEIKANRKVIIAMLDEFPFEFIEAESGLEAIELAKTNSFNLILLDIKMPKKDGFRTILKLKEIGESANTPVIAVTATVLKNSIEKIKQYDFNGLLLKPFEYDDIVSMLLRFLPYSIRKIENSTSKSKDDFVNIIQIDNTDLLSELIGVYNSEQEGFSEFHSSKTIKKIGEAIISKAKKYNHHELKLFGQKLLQELKVFNIENVKKLLDEFKTLIFIYESNKN